MFANFSARISFRKLLHDVHKVLAATSGRCYGVRNRSALATLCPSHLAQDIWNVRLHRSVVIWEILSIFLLDVFYFIRCESSTCIQEKWKHTPWVHIVRQKKTISYWMIIPLALQFLMLHALSCFISRVPLWLCSFKSNGQLYVSHIYVVRLSKYLHIIFVVANKIAEIFLPETQTLHGLRRKTVFQIVWIRWCSWQLEKICGQNLRA